MARADSAGVPWTGRRFERNSSATDDGSAPEALVRAIERFRDRGADEADVVDAVRTARLLIPLVAERGDVGKSDTGLVVDKSQELSIVTVLGPDGRTALPVFSSVAAMNRWNPAARPIPADAPRVAQAAVSETTDVVVIDPTSETEFAIRRPALWAIATEQAWLPGYRDVDVRGAFLSGIAGEPDVLSLEISAGDPDARLAGPEVIVRMTLRDGLDREAIDSLVARATARWAESEVIAERVDSMRLRLERAET